ncbi:hypothetical protein KTT_49140 [Tengunoibacter tsumagoiensis]|uniref:Uncharacterized protein n=1 Tax=Tengunoibacter tsumagoiensis TaxID=2014871 RepID=A0A402A7R6_9CHLR|nr:hypothetical protein KTT_49140 [Tengunoibacter tsumagoiensis]
MICARGVRIPMQVIASDLEYELANTQRTAIKEEFDKEEETIKMLKVVRS